jgi:hypothetical protein
MASRQQALYLIWTKLRGRWERAVRKDGSNYAAGSLLEFSSKNNGKLTVSLVNNLELFSFKSKSSSSSLDTEVQCGNLHLRKGQKENLVPRSSSSEVNTISSCVQIHHHLLDIYLAKFLTTIKTDSLTKKSI